MLAGTPAVDLHSHSDVSDGTLAPADLVDRAHANGVAVLALTDHDTVAGLRVAGEAAARVGVRLVPGVEISVTWMGRTLHVLGLDVRPDAPLLRGGLSTLQSVRRERAEEMGRRLEKAGIPDAYDGALRLAGAGQVTRTHFARFLVNAGYSADVNKAFQRYLSRGRPGYVRVKWADLDESIGWIRASGGIPVLAHPLSYGLTGAWLSRVLSAFTDAGGQALEVVCGARTQREAIALSAGYARRFGLLGSVGSDFHTPDTPWIDLGRLPPLPESLEPVWTRFRDFQGPGRASATEPRLDGAGTRV